MKKDHVFLVDDDRDLLASASDWIEMNGFQVTGFSNAVYSLAMQSDGKIIVGGRFASINGTASNGIARLNSDGTPDSAYTTAIGSGFSSSVSAVVTLNDTLS